MQIISVQICISSLLYFYTPTVCGEGGILLTFKDYNGLRYYIKCQIYLI